MFHLRPCFSIKEAYIKITKYITSSEYNVLVQDFWPLPNAHSQLQIEKKNKPKCLKASGDQSKACIAIHASWKKKRQGHSHQDLRPCCN
jgi:hypothetical protein